MNGRFKQIHTGLTESVGRTTRDTYTTLAADWHRPTEKSDYGVFGMRRVCSSPLHHHLHTHTLTLPPTHALYLVHSRPLALRVRGCPGETGSLGDRGAGLSRTR